MSEIEKFTNGNSMNVRVVIDDNGEPWFVVKDVCDYFGITNRNRLLQSLDDDEKGGTRIDTPGGEQTFTTISESGLYKILFQLEPHEARGLSDEEVEEKYSKVHAFRRWVTHDVLPTIRRHGAYATPDTVEAMLADPDTMIATLTALKAERRKSARLAEDNAELAPKAMVYDVAIEADGTMSVTEAARYLHQHDRAMTRTRLIALLRADGKLCRDSLAPTREALDRGYMVQMLTTRGDGTANRPYAHVTRKGLGWCIRRYCASTEVA